MAGLTSDTLNELAERLTARHQLAAKWLGALPSDGLPEKAPHSFTAVVNLDPHDAPGSHWVALRREGGDSIEYYDPLGMSPGMDEAIFHERKQDLLRWLRHHPWRQMLPEVHRVEPMASVECGVYSLLACCRGGKKALRRLRELPAPDRDRAALKELTRLAAL